MILQYDGLSSGILIRRNVRPINFAFFQFVYSWPKLVVNSTIDGIDSIRDSRINSIDSRNEVIVDGHICFLESLDSRTEFIVDGTVYSVHRVLPCLLQMRKPVIHVIVHRDDGIVQCLDSTVGRLLVCREGSVQVVCHRLQVGDIRSYLVIDGSVDGVDRVSNERINGLDGGGHVLIQLVNHVVNALLLGGQFPNCRQCLAIIGEVVC